MNKIKLVLVVLMLACFVSAEAQQDPLFSQYMFNMMAVNPAYAGSRDVMSVTTLYRNQWYGVAGAPVTGTIAIDAPVRSKKIGLGLIIVSDKVGVTSNNSLTGNYSYRLRLSEKGVLSLGLNATVQNYRANYGSVSTVTAGDPTFASAISKWMPNLGAGAYYTTDRFYVGLSLPHLINNNLNSKDVSPESRQYRTWFLTSGYVFILDQSMALKTSTLLKYVNNAPLEVDVNANLWFNNRIGIGASYRTSSDLVALLELQVSDQFRFGYAYDYSLSKLNQYSTGSHELMLRYEFGFKRKKLLSPRYF